MFIVNIWGSLLKIYSFSGRLPIEITLVTFLQLGQGIFIMSSPLFSLSSPRHVWQNVCPHYNILGTFNYRSYGNAQIWHSIWFKLLTCSSWGTFLGSSLLWSALTLAFPELDLDEFLPTPLGLWCEQWSPWFDFESSNLPVILHVSFLSIISLWLFWSKVWLLSNLF